ncbi:hypothetical protein TsFJ059_009264 [Trichoderma semiorbis]|uniref:Uncharacterized protein n=1 Tax=Trichoderma semiorbis TaxID=1491008 RepID=A0A9P8HIE2_9HYPO|nr:hypothetical protein TsFJ059_009264 [Trichoderma semiorbis]
MGFAAKAPKWPHGPSPGADKDPEARNEGDQRNTLFVGSSRQRAMLQPRFACVLANVTLDEQTLDWTSTSGN